MTIATVAAAGHGATAGAIPGGTSVAAPPRSRARPPRTLFTTVTTAGETRTAVSPGSRPHGWDKARATPARP